MKTNFGGCLHVSMQVTWCWCRTQNLKRFTHNQSEIKQQKNVNTDEVFRKGNKYVDIKFRVSGTILIRYSQSWNIRKTNKQLGPIMHDIYTCRCAMNSQNQCIRKNSITSSYEAMFKWLSFFKEIYDFNLVILVRNTYFS